MIFFLIGFMGAGKSYAANKMSEQLGVDMIDLDEYIEQKTESSIANLFIQKGEAYFREIEKMYLHQIGETPPSKPLIVSTGGGTPCFFDNMQFMKLQGLVVWINTEKSLVLKRLQAEKEKRPSLKDLNEKELLQFVEKKIEERETYYRQAHFITRDVTFMELKKYLIQHSS